MKACRFCGETDPQKLYEDRTIGQAPLIQCWDFAGQCLTVRVREARALCGPDGDS